MPVVEMPNGDRVRFPDDMPPEQIRGLILRKFPDAERMAREPRQTQQPTTTIGDVDKSLRSGLAQGAIGLVGLPGDFVSAARSGADWLLDRTMGARTGDGSTDFNTNLVTKHLTSDAIRGTIERLAGQEFYQPQTTAGEYAETVGQFVPSAAAFGGGTVGNVVRYGVVPALASETAGQVTEGTSVEPFARTGAALVAGLGAGMTARPNTPAAALGQGLPRGMTAQHVDDAERLIRQAQQQGITLTWPEALSQATGGRVALADVQRFLENAPQSAPIMREALAGRPAQIDSAFRSVADDAFGPAVRNPAAVGLRVRELAGNRLGGIRRRINSVTRNLYEQAEPRRVKPQIFEAMNRDPAVKAAMTAIRNDPELSRLLGNNADDSVAMMDALKKYFDDLAEVASRGGDNTRAGIRSGIAGRARSAASDASPEYARALETQARLRRNVLDPAEAGTLGHLAATDDLAGQGRVLFQAAPLEGSGRDVARTIRRMAAQDPDATLQLARSYMVRQFDELTQNLTSGPNSFAGARFAAVMRGNPEQAKNLQAAIRALPDGNVRWRGFRKLLDTLEATGRRAPAGSPTEFNRLIGEAARKGHPLDIDNIATAIASPAKWPSAAREWYREFRLGRNAEGMAHIITDPRSGDLFRQLLSARGVEDRAAHAARLLVIGSVPTRVPTPAQPNQGSPSR